MTNIVLRFAALQARGVVKSWAELRELVDKHDFPEGFRPTPHTRAWTGTNQTERIKVMSMLKKWFPSKYLAASEVEEDEIVTIKRISDEPVGPTQEVKPVMYLREHEKAIILNSTNATAIAKLYGDDDPYTDWVGKQVALYIEMVRNPATKETGPAIRIKPPKKAKKEATPMSAALDDEIPGNWN